MDQGPINAGKDRINYVMYRYVWIWRHNMLDFYADSSEIPSNFLWENFGTAATRYPLQPRRFRHRSDNFARQQHAPKPLQLPS